jgi:tetratricopeptide (TPR) repeat protein
MGRTQKDRSISFYNRGNAYQKIADYYRAIADYTEAIRLDSNNSNAYNNRGVTYRTLGDQQRAQADFSAAQTAKVRQQQEAETQQIRTELGQGYRRITFEDFQLDGKKLAMEQARVSVRGVYKKVGQIEYLFPSENALVLATQKFETDDTAIPILSDDAVRDFRQVLLHCRTSSQFCPVVVLGHVTICEKTTLVGGTGVPCLAVENGVGGPPQ